VLRSGGGRRTGAWGVRRMSSAEGRGVAGICDRVLLFRMRAPVRRARPSAFLERSGRRKRRNARQGRLFVDLVRPTFSVRSPTPSSICLFHGPNSLDKGADFSGIFFAGLALDAGG